MLCILCSGLFSLSETNCIWVWKKLKRLHSKIIYFKAYQLELLWSAVLCWRLSRSPFRALDVLQHTFAHRFLKYDFFCKLHIHSPISIMISIVLFGLQWRGCFSELKHCEYFRVNRPLYLLQSPLIFQKWLKQVSEIWPISWTPSFLANIIYNNLLCCMFQYLQIFDISISTNNWYFNIDKYLISFNIVQVLLINYVLQAGLPDSEHVRGLVFSL